MSFDDHYYMAIIHVHIYSTIFLSHDLRLYVNEKFITTHKKCSTGKRLFYQETKIHTAILVMISQDIKVKIVPQYQCTNFKKI